MEHFEDKYHQYLNRESSGESEWSDDETAMKEFLDQSAQLKPAGFTKSKEDLWQSISDEVDGEQEQKVKTIQWGKVFSMAAAIAVLLTVGLVLFNQDDASRVNLAVNEQGKEIVTLPDGSTVSLNAVSELSYMASENTWDRTLQMSGEAFFQVKKGETFTVNTDFGAVKVLGTSFNVSTRNDVFAVSCKTGRVEVSFKDSNRPTEILTKGQTVVFEKNEMKRAEVDADRIGQWYEGTFYYDERPVKEAFNEIERQYDIDLQYNDQSIASRLYKGYFYKEDLATSLSMICDALGLSYTIDGRVVTIEANME